MQWDRQEEFSTRPTTPLPTERPQQQPQAKPASETSIKPTQNLPRPSAVPLREDYADLQIAVRDRYPNTTKPNAEKPGINELPSEVVIPIRKPTSTQYSEPGQTAIPNPFSNILRPNKLDYAHVRKTRTHPTVSFRATNADIFNLDDPTSFGEKTKFATETPTQLSEPPTTEEPAPNPESNQRN